MVSHFSVKLRKNFVLSDYIHMERIFSPSVLMVVNYYVLLRTSFDCLLVFIIAGKPAVNIIRAFKKANVHFLTLLKLPLVLDFQ